MTPTTEAVYRSALALSDAEREELIDALLDPGGPTDTLLTGDAWLAEIHRRSAAYDSGADPGIPWPEARRRVRAELGLPADG